jgi:hypothetical protein
LRYIFSYLHCFLVSLILVRVRRLFIIKVSPRWISQFLFFPCHSKGIYWKLSGNVKRQILKQRVRINLCIGGLRKKRTQEMEMCNIAVFSKNLSAKEIDILQSDKSDITY